MFVRPRTNVKGCLNTHPDFSEKMPSGYLDKSLFARQFTRLRNEKGWNKTEAAEALSVSHSTIVQWEAGQWAPEPENLARICQVFGVPQSIFANRSAADEFERGIRHAVQHILDALSEIAELPEPLQRPPPDRISEGPE